MSHKIFVYFKEAVFVIVYCHYRKEEDYEIPTHKANVVSKVAT